MYIKRISNLMRDLKPFIKSCVIHVINAELKSNFYAIVYDTIDLFLNI